MRTYTVDSQVYEGFDRKVRSAELIAVAVVEGSNEVWAISSIDSLKELRAYYANVHNLVPEFLTVYRLEG